MSKSIFDRISSAEDLVAKDTKELAGFIMEDLAYDSSPLRWNPDNYASFISPGYKNCNQEEVQRSILEAWYWLVSKGYLVPKGDAGWFVTSRKGASIRVATDLQIQLRQGIREAMEKLVYEETRGNEECYLNFRELANRKGLDDSEIDDVLQHLKGEGLIKDIHNGFTIAITHRLRKKIEQPVDSQKKSHPQTVIYQGVFMNDQYNVGQAGAVGPGSHAHDMTFNQIWQKLGSEIPLAQLPSQLSALRHEMKKAATEPDQDIAVAEVAKAEIAAKAGDGPTVLKALKSAGNWALEIAKKIGVELAAKLIMAAIESPGA